MLLTLLQTFYTQEEKENNYTHKVWFSKPFVASVVGLEIPAGKKSCVKIEWIVCRRQGKYRGITCYLNI